MLKTLVNSGAWQRGNTFTKQELEAGELPSDILLQWHYYCPAGANPMAC